jgi:hypothetical protein
MKKILARLLLAALALWAAWTAVQALAFKRYVSESSERSAGPPFEVVGAYHMHTLFSDGRKDADAVAAAAAEAGLDFIVLTDHGNPNNDSLDAQGMRAGIRVLAGSEMSTSRGHLVALGFKRPGRTTVFSREAEAAAAEVAALGGFTIIAHPYSKTRWSWGDAAVFDGIEILDGDSMLKRNIPRTILYAPLLLLRPSAALLALTAPPQASLRKWDELLRRRPTLGFFSSDAHIFYRAIFGVFHLHVLLDRPLPADFEAARADLFEALERGRFYSAVDGAAGAHGFRCALDGSTLRIATPFSFAFETFVFRDGREALRTSEREVAFPLDRPGTYRVEVHLRERSPLRAGVPWIISNPIPYGR